MKLYSKTHEWVKVKGKIVTLGISDHAQDSLGDITFVEFPKVGDEVDIESELGVIESVKAASDFYSPVNGKVIEVNSKLENEPEIINESPEEEGWILKIEMYENLENTSHLMTETEYETILNKG